MNLYRIFWLENTRLRHSVVEALDISAAVQAASSPPSIREYISTGGGIVNGCPIVKVELLLDINDGTV